MTPRRDFIQKMGSLLLLPMLNTNPLFVMLQSSTLPPGIGTAPDYSGPLPKVPKGGTLGNRPPLNSEERIAKAIITRAPVGPTPFAVAKFFLEISNGKFGQIWQPYAQGWPVRWNPVIVNFFQATNTTPEGDLTAWCAAFVNWCFLHIGKGMATQSASSGSFRMFGIETHTPTVGDLVVFRRATPDGTHDERGHVGFYVRSTADEIEVLGGNQIEGVEGCHKISSKPFTKSGQKLIFHSYRTDPRLHA